MIKYNNEIENMNSIMYSIFNRLPLLDSNIFQSKELKKISCNSIFNNLPIELVRIIKIYVGFISKDLLFIFDRLKSKGITWAVYENPTTAIYRIVKIIPLLFKKGKYIKVWNLPKIDKNTLRRQIETQTEIITDFPDYDLNEYDFEYFYKYTIECLKSFGQEVGHRPYPIRNIYISRLDLIISFLLLGYELDIDVFNYNINCICKLNYDFCDNEYIIEYKKKDEVIKTFNEPTSII
jgi:hypothetical protein